MLLYIERWLKAPVCMPDGTLAERSQGTPQGVVISPLLANLFLHDAIDRWMAEQYSALPFERYADDISCHCGSEAQARALRDALGQRLMQWHLELHPHKTKIVYCKDANRRGSYPKYRLDFLGYTFRPRSSKNRMGKLFVSFAPAVSEKAAKTMRQRIRRWRLHHRNDLGLNDLARWTRPMVMGWVHETTGDFTLRPSVAPCARWMSSWCDGRNGNTLDSARTKGEPGNSCGGSVPASLTCLHIGRRW